MPDEIQPVLVLLREQFEADWQAIRLAFPELRRWGQLAEPERARLSSALTETVSRMVATQENLRRLPMTTACVCRHCRAVTLPITGDGSVYSHCGRMWMSQARLGFTALPADFWETHKPGDVYAGQLAAEWAEEEEEDNDETERGRPRGARPKGNQQRRVRRAGA